MSDGSDAPDARLSAAPAARIESASDEVVQHPARPARLPGARRDGYTKLPTGPVGIEPVVVTGPDIDAPDESEWEPSTGAIPADDTRLAPWALLAAIVALGASFFVGWGIPVAVVAVIAAIMSLRRPVESRAIARWALVLGLCATVYSLGWLVWAGMQFERLG
ncbi:hypothetical protein AB0E56_15730 [Microbacterium sp. NPDC028030]|uniref:hypothetical protein n=1 Tax=Microbacterium sp. NPDC028030 TaxID=3155124 RepID=UPI0033DC9590